METVKQIRIGNVKGGIVDLEAILKRASDTGIEDETEMKGLLLDD